MPAVSWLERLRDTVADRGRELLGLREGDARDTLGALCQRLVAGRGEATNIALAREILQRYEKLDETGKTAFLVGLAEPERRAFDGPSRRCVDDDPRDRRFAR